MLSTELVRTNGIAIDVMPLFSVGVPGPMHGATRGMTGSANPTTGMGCWRLSVSLESFTWDKYNQG